MKGRRVKGEEEDEGRRVTGRAQWRLVHACAKKWKAHRDGGISTVTR